MRRAAVVERVNASRPNRPSLTLELSAAAIVIAAGAIAITQLNAEPKLPALKAPVPFEGSVYHMAQLRCPLTDSDVVIDWVMTHNDMSSAGFGDLQNDQLIIFPDCPQPATTTTTTQN